MEFHFEKCAQKLCLICARHVKKSLKTPNNSQFHGHRKANEIRLVAEIIGFINWLRLVSDSVNPGLNPGLPAIENQGDYRPCDNPLFKGTKSLRNTMLSSPHRNVKNWNRPLLSINSSRYYQTQRQTTEPTIFLTIRVRVSQSMSLKCRKHCRKPVAKINPFTPACRADGVFHPQ